MSRRRSLVEVAPDRGAYLNSARAAEYCGYTAEDFKRPRRAFMQAINRYGVPKCFVGRRARFLVRDLDEFLQGARGFVPGAGRRLG